MIRWWRNDGVWVLIFISILSLCYAIPMWCAGVAFLLAMTIPCGIPLINENKWLWWTRQLFFLITGVTLLLT